MFLVKECMTGFLEILMALVLSHKIGIGSLHFMCMSCRVCFIQIINGQQYYVAIYYAYTVDKDTEDYFLLDQETRQLPRNNVVPLVLLLSPTYLAQFASE